MTARRTRSRRFATVGTRSSTSSAAAAWGSSSARTIASWDACLDAIERARAAARGGRPTADLESAVEEAAAVATAGRAAAHRDWTAKTARLALETRLDELRFDAWSLIDREHLHSEYARIFRDRGIDLVGNPPPDFSTLADGDLLGRAVSQWALLAAREQRPVDERDEALHRIAEAFDPTGLRTRLRAAWRARDGDALDAICAEERLADASAHTLEYASMCVAGLASPEAAFAVLERARRRHPHDFEIARQLGHWAGECCPEKQARQGDLLMSALALRPNSVRVRLDLAAACQRAGDFAAAHAWIDEAAEAKPGHPSVVYQRANLLAKSGDDEGANRLLEQPNAEQPGFARAWFLRGFNAARRGRLEDAERWLLESTRLAPSDGDAWSALGLAQELARKNGAARESYMRATHLEPCSWSTWYGLTGVCLRLELWTQARSAAEQTVRWAPRRADAHDLLGIAPHRNPRFGAALRAWRKAKELGADPTVAARLDARIREGIRNADLADRADAMLRASTLPSAEEARDVRRFLERHRMWARLAGTWRHTFEHEPGAPWTDLVTAAAAAVRAARGDGTDPHDEAATPAARLAHLASALTWLERAETAAGASPSARRRLAVMLERPPFAGLRDDLPHDAPAAAWTVFWDRIDTDRAP